MTTKYDVGDTIMIPFKVTNIHIYDKDSCTYEGYIDSDTEQAIDLTNHDIDSILAIKSEDE